MDMRCVLSASGSWAPPEGRMALNIARFDKRGKAKEAAFDLNQVGGITLPQYRHSALWSSIHSTQIIRRNCHLRDQDRRFRLAHRESRREAWSGSPDGQRWGSRRA